MDLRKIDGLIAEHVLGLPNVIYAEQYGCFQFSVDGVIAHFVPKYSSDISAAFTALREEGSMYSISPHEVNLHSADRNNIIINIEDDTIEAICTAICLAVLKSRGVNVGT